MTLQKSNSRQSFAVLALGVLLERIAASTQELVQLRASLQSDSFAQESRSRTNSPQPDLARACDGIEHDGWLFGVFARELGSDALFERRERRGLEHALGLVREILRREGIEIEMPDLPELDTADERGATLCAVVARCVHAAQRDGARDWCFSRAGSDTALCLQGSVDECLESALREGAARLEGAQLVRDPDGIRLVLPQGCVIWP